MERERSRSPRRVRVPTIEEHREWAHLLQHHASEFLRLWCTLMERTLQGWAQAAAFQGGTQAAQAHDEERARTPPRRPLPPPLGTLLASSRVYIPLMLSSVQVDRLCRWTWAAAFFRTCALPGRAAQPEPRRSDEGEAGRGASAKIYVYLYIYIYIYIYGDVTDTSVWMLKACEHTVRPQCEGHEPASGSGQQAPAAGNS